MQGYSRLGVYNKNLIAKKTAGKEKKASKDWVNIALFVLLIVVLVLFIIT
ncbi:hypothetical protein JXB41_08475 [Candidatus Woesearchaeota archaeon]|nr:hypothetical protein [Candidatus Woesearchaeota archaeon]